MTQVLDMHPTQLTLNDVIDSIANLDQFKTNLLCVNEALALYIYPSFLSVFLDFCLSQNKGERGYEAWILD